MKITKENMEHVQEILDRYGVSGLNDLDQKLFEWQESNMKEYDVEVTRAVTFKIRVRAISFDAACNAGELVLDSFPDGPDANHGDYTIHPRAPFDTTTYANEVKDAQG